MERSCDPVGVPALNSRSEAVCATNRTLHVPADCLAIITLPGYFVARLNRHTIEIVAEFNVFLDARRLDCLISPSDADGASR
jgi:hypothetical protein